MKENVSDSCPTNPEKICRDVRGHFIEKKQHFKYVAIKQVKLYKKIKKLNSNKSTILSINLVEKIVIDVKLCYSESQLVASLL